MDQGWFVSLTVRNGNVKQVVQMLQSYRNWQMFLENNFNYDVLLRHLDYVIVESNL